MVAPPQFTSYGVVLLNIPPKACENILSWRLVIDLTLRVPRSLARPRLRFCIHAIVPLVSNAECPVKQTKGGLAPCDGRLDIGRGSRTDSSLAIPRGD